jgi:uncharacterized protein YaiI (UPF0178 family)
MKEMKIFVDADSCPHLVREAVLRAAQRLSISAVFVANRRIPGIGGEGAIMELCPVEEGAADNRIVELATGGDLVITRDIPLANRLVEGAVTVLDDHGRLYTRENIRYQLSLRDFMVELAESGLGAARSARYGKKELKVFADSFDRILTRLIKREDPAAL